MLEDELIMQILQEYIESKIELSSENMTKVLKAFDQKTFKNNRLIVRGGQFVTKIFFIAKGGVRIVMDLPEKEVTTWIIFENNFFSNLHAIKTGSASKYKIAAVGDTEVYSIDANVFYKFYQEIPEWEKFGRLTIEDAFLDIIDSLISFKTMDAEERYLKLLSKTDIINRIPLKHLASYLGVTPNSLSRIRKNL